MRVLGLVSFQSQRLARQSKTAERDSDSTAIIALQDVRDMIDNAKAEELRTQQFRDAALPYLDDVYSLANFLMRNSTDAEDAVQDCLLRAFRHFEQCRGTDIKVWLLAILRNVCRSEFARRAKSEVLEALPDWDVAPVEPVWQAPQATPEVIVQGRQDVAAIRRLVESLPAPFRETVVLREFHELSYSKIAEVAGVPIGTVMSRLARGRAMLLAAWQDGEAATPRTLAMSDET